MAKWFVMPEGVDSISVQQMEFHPKVVADGVRYFAVPDHLQAELEKVNICTGQVDGKPVMARFLEVSPPNGVEEPEFPTTDSMAVVAAVQGQILSLQVRLESLQAQIAELTVERDRLQMRVVELEATIAELRGEEENNVEVSQPLRISDSPADSLLDKLSGMTLGRD